MTPAACEKQTGKGWVARHSGLLALWPSGCGTGSCLFFTDTEGSDLAGSCLALRTLTTLGLVWPSRPLTTLGLVVALWALTSLGQSGPQGSDLAGSDYSPWAFDHAGSVEESSRSSGSLGDLLSL